MPLVEIPKLQLVREVRASAASPLFSNVREFRNFLSLKSTEHGVFNIGDGAQRFVFAAPEDSGKAVVVNFADRSSSEAKLAFYLQRIYSTLWPSNFPHMYGAVGSKNERNPAVSIRERILGGRIKSLGDFTKIKEMSPEDSPKSFKQVIVDSRAYGIPLPIDIMPSNYVLGEDGGEYYVDEIDWNEFRNVQPFPEKGILRFMEDRGFSAVQKRQVKTSIERIKVLIAGSVPGTKAA
jgi:hypothetical protein